MTTITATLSGIAVRKKTKQPMVLLDQSTATCAAGIGNDLRGKPGRRQVTVMSAECWQQACNEAGKQLHWQQRRANLLISGLQFSAQTIGSIIRIGEAELLITRATDPCRRMDQTLPGLSQALAKSWRGGVCCQVIKDGAIRVGDNVILKNPP